MIKHVICIMIRLSHPMSTVHLTTHRCSGARNDGADTRRANEAIYDMNQAMPYRMLTMCVGS